jgi:hypothetical protein
MAIESSQLGGAQSRRRRRIERDDPSTTAAVSPPKAPAPCAPPAQVPGMLMKNSSDRPAGCAAIAIMRSARRAARERSPSTSMSASAPPA